jgi:hypothetical protein
MLTPDTTMRLSPHFTLAELCASTTAQARGIDNTPAPELLPRLIMLAEMLERTAPFRPGICGHQRLVDGLKAIAWMLLAVGAAGAMISPLLSHQPTLDQVCVLAGFAVLVVRTRIKEG